VVDVAGAKEIAASAHAAEAPNVNWTVVAVPTPVSDSPHPYTVVQAPEREYPVPAVNVELDEAVSELPMTIELVAGVNEVTEVVEDPVDENPVEDCGPDVVTPASSNIEIEPVTAVGKVAVIVSAPALAAVEYQT